MNIKRVRKRIDKYVKTHPQYRHLKTVLQLGIMMKGYGFSLRRRAVPRERLTQGGRPQTCSVKVMAAQVAGDAAHGMLDELVLFTAGRAAYAYFSVDSTHHRFNRYTLVDYTKKANTKGQEAGEGDAAKEQR